MRRLFACLLSVLLVLSSVPVATAANVAGFEDAPVVVPMVDGVTLAPKGTASITPLGGAGDGAALLEVSLSGLGANKPYHLIAYCTVGPLDGCVPRNYIPQLVDYIHDLGPVTADARGRLETSFLIEDLPDGSYGWHVVVSAPGYERYAVVIGNVGRHIHNDSPHEASFDVALTAGSLCGLTRQYVDQAGVANSLCVKLRAADAAAARGQDVPHDNDLEAYQREVAAQTGKLITPAHAAVLTRLAEELQNAPAAPATPKRARPSRGSESPSGRARS